MRRCMRYRAVTTLHDAACGCCGRPAELWMSGETFFGGSCRRCGPILATSHDVAAELVRQVRAGLGRQPRRCWLRSAIHWIQTLSRTQR